MTLWPARSDPAKPPGPQITYWPQQFDPARAATEPTLFSDTLFNHDGALTPGMRTSSPNPTTPGGMQMAQNAAPPQLPAAGPPGVQLAPEQLHARAKAIYGEEFIWMYQEGIGDQYSKHQNNGYEALLRMGPFVNTTGATPQQLKDKVGIGKGPRAFITFDGKTHE